MKNFTIIISALFTTFAFSQNAYVDPSIKSDNYFPVKAKQSSLSTYTFLDTGLNTELTEIGATFFKEKFIVITNKKRRHTTTILNENTNTFNNNSYCVDVDKNGNFSYPLHFSKVLDTDFNEGIMAFNADESRIYFVQTTSNESTNYQLFTAEFDDEVNGKWKNKKVVSISSEEYSIETPYIDKVTNTIYFSSNMPNGFGGFDLYKATISEDGELTDVANLGSEINSASDEKYAFTSSNGQYLYFSSNNKKSLGGYDVFRASDVKPGYTNIVNMGGSLNSTKDEIGFMLVTKNQGYISVNDVAASQNFDILKFAMTQMDQRLNLEVVALNSNIPVPQASVVISDEFGNEIYNGKTNDSGNISLDIIPLTQYKITANKEGYETIEDIVPAGSTLPTLNRTISLVEKPAFVTEDAIIVDNILFDFDKAAIKNESQASLNKVIAALNENAGLAIVVNAHTDNKGSDKYNQVLSEKRAKSAYDFLVKNGVASSRIAYKGYGESQPLYKCDSCTAEQDQLNRRVEFKIVKKDIIEEVIIDKN